MFDDDSKAAAIKLHSHKDIKTRAAKARFTTTGNDHTTHIKGETHIQKVGKALNLQTDKSVHLINGDSHIHITDSDITVSAKQIKLGRLGQPSVPDGDNLAKGIMSGGQKPGEGSSSSSTDSTQNTQPNLFPSADVKIVDWILRQGPTEVRVFDAVYQLDIETNINATLNVSNTNSVSSITFNQKGFELEVKNEVAKVFSTLKVADTAEIINQNLGVSISNAYGSYQFHLTTVIKTSSLIELAGTLSKSIAIKENDWRLGGDINMDMKVILRKVPYDEGLLPSLIGKWWH